MKFHCRLKLTAVFLKPRSKCDICVNNKILFSPFISRIFPPGWISRWNALHIGRLGWLPVAQRDYSSRIRIWFRNLTKRICSLSDTGLQETKNLNRYPLFFKTISKSRSNLKVIIFGTWFSSDEWRCSF